MAYWWIILVVLVILFSAIIIFLKFQFYPSDTMKIPLQSDDVEIMIIKERNVNCYIVKTESDIIFLDSGIGKNTPKEMHKLGIRPEQVSHVFLTHSDYDHVGGLKYFTQAQIYFGKNEEKMMNGQIKRFMGIVSNDPINREYTLLKDLEEIKTDSLKIKAIHTPGHTAGHTCYIVNDKFVFTGDLLLIKDEKIKPFFPLINIDNEKLRESITKLVNNFRTVPVEILCTGHTGYSNKVQILLQSWL